MRLQCAARSCFRSADLCAKKLPSTRRRIRTVARLQIFEVDLMAKSLISVGEMARDVHTGQKNRLFGRVQIEEKRAISFIYKKDHRCEKKH